MKVLLTTLNSKFIHTCLALRYLKHSVNSICECDMREYTINENIESIFADIYRGNYDIIGFSCYIWNIEPILKICSSLKAANPKLKIILGGPEVSFDSIELIKKNKFIDFIIKGEGENTIVSLINTISYDVQNYNIDSIVYKRDKLPEYTGYKFVENETFFIIENKDDNIINDLSSIKSPYTDVTTEEIENKIVYYETSRGCTFNCSYCLSSILKGVRFFPLERVKKDLKKLVDMNAKQIKFVDRTFNSHKDKTLELIKYLKEIDNNIINFHFEITAHMLQDDFMKEIKDARYGLFQFEIGVQSTNNETIKAVNRIDNFEKLSNRVRQVKEYGNIHQHLDLIAGLPYEDIESFKKSFNDVFSLQPEALQLGFLKMLKGSPIREQTDDFGYIYRKYPPYEVISNCFITANDILYLKEIEEILDIFYNSGMFLYSMKYLFENLYKNNPFKMFEELLEFKNKFSPFKNISRDKNYELIWSFGQIKLSKDKDAFIEILKFDYLRMGRNRVIPNYLRNRTSISREDAVSWVSKDFVRKELGYFSLHPMEMIKKIHVELFEYNIIDYILNQIDLMNKKTIVAFDYGGNKDFMDKVKFVGGYYDQI